MLSKNLMTLELKKMALSKKRQNRASKRSCISISCAFIASVIIALVTMGPLKTTLTMLSLTIEESSVDVTHSELVSQSTLETKSVMRHNHWVQYGPPRTATSLQFTIVCMGMFMRLRGTNEAEQMSCVFNPVPKRRFERITKKEGNRPLVIKTHSGRYINEVWGPPNTTSVFMTSKMREKDKEYIESVRKFGYTIPFVQSVSDVSKLSHQILYEYQSVFELPDEDMMLLGEFMRYWDILRQCCGVQMSSSWRQQLLDENITSNEHNPWYSACDTYNISRVESRFMSSILFNEINRLPRLRSMLRVSGRDAELNGSYCERYNTAVRRNHLHFNQMMPS
uniref:Uncharacterized protein n=1 Tax=Aplanochytrium stocchinoi TaxID=215587 RepID=A0A6S8C759_9STRA